MQASLACEAARSKLEHLGLLVARDALDNVLEIVRLEDLSVAEALDRLLGMEAHARHERTVETNMKFAGLPYRRTLEEYDFGAQPGLDREVMDRLSTMRFMAEGVNVIFLGPPGVGKTHLAVGLTLKAIEAGHKAYFTTMSDLVRKYHEAARQDRLGRLLGILARPALLVLDEIGYTQLERPEGSFLFDVIAVRYQRQKPLILTSNKSWGRWGEILPDNIMTAALLDRLLHRSITVNIQGESYRLRDHRKLGLIPELNSESEGRNAEKNSVTPKPAKPSH